MHTHLDHFVVVANTLPEGVRWCESVLGVTPVAGGEHALMGTHNRLINISSADFPHAFLEVIAINPCAVPTRSAGQKRWFDLDDPALQQRLNMHGPQLMHWVARVDDLPAALTALTALAAPHSAFGTPPSLDVGPPIAASRRTDQGLLQWQITVRDDGRRPLHGALPTLLDWGNATHPCQHLPAQGVALLGFHAELPPREGAQLSAALHALHLQPPVRVRPGPAQLVVRLETPHGAVTIAHPLII